MNKSKADIILNYISESDKRLSLSILADEFNYSREGIRFIINQAGYNYKDIINDHNFKIDTNYLNLIKKAKLKDSKINIKKIAKDNNIKYSYLIKLYNQREVM